MDTSDEMKHPIFTTDPAEWMQYMNKEVRVTVDGNRMVQTGWVYTIDPVSRSVVLLQFPADEISSPPKLIVVMGHAVQSISVIDENMEKHKHELDTVFRPKQLALATPEEMKKKLSMLKCWLLKNRIPVEVTGTDSEVLSISGALTIKPPYEPQDCISTNEIILGRIQGLIKNMPSDVEDW